MLYSDLSDHDADKNLREIKQRLALYRLIAEHSHEMELFHGPDGTLYFVSPSCETLTGYPPQAFLDDPDFLKKIIHPDNGYAWTPFKERLKSEDRQSVFELRIQQAGGAERFVECRSTRIVSKEGESIGLRSTIRDISDFKALEARYEQVSLHDPLTGFANRALCLERIKHVMERTKRHDDYRFAVIYFDVDKLKSVNFRYGPSIGDDLIRRAGRRLLSCLRGMDAISRISGDKFVIILEEVASGKDVVTVVKRIIREIERPFELDADQIHLSACMGIVLSPADYDRPEDLLRNANIAMRRAKDSERCKFKFFHTRLLDEAVKAIAMEQDLRKALERGEFSLQYQPIISLETHSLTGMEALIRWNHPQKGCVMPIDFIPVAEDSGLIIPIGRWVLFEACSKMAEWRALYPHMKDLNINVNISAKQLGEPDFLKTVVEALRASGLPASTLNLEITESVLMENTELCVLKVKRLKGLGVKLSIDDFGTGYSSLSYLHAFPIDTLKVDRSFVSRMERNEKSHEIVQAIINLAHNFGLDVCAEGVEIEEQSDLLSGLSCETVQGFLFSRPLDPDKVEAFLSSAASARTAERGVHEIR